MVPGIVAQFNAPYGICIDAYNNLYVTEKNNHTIRKITSAGVVTTFAGSGVSGSLDATGIAAQFNAPAGIFNYYGDISVADYGNKLLRKVTTSAVVTKLLINDAPYIVSNAAYDELGNVLFSVKNDIVYSATGMPVGKLDDYSSGGYTYSHIQNEITIIPVPGTCRDFYVFYVKGSGPWTSGLCCARLSITSSGNISLIDSWLLQVGGPNFIALAASRLDPDSGTRTLYCLERHSVKKYIISASGISSAITVAASPGIGGAAYELELSPDELTLAWGDVSNGTITTMVISNAFRQTFSLPGSNITFHGIEFSTDNLNIYASVDYALTPASKGLYKLQLSTGTFTQLTNNTYHRTQLELARDGYIYMVNGDGVSAGVLGRITPATDVIADNILSIPIQSTEASGLSGGLYRLPDQVDGDNYDYFFGVAKLNGTFKINGSNTSPTVAVNTYTCSTINLTNTANSATSYRITINKTDASGNILTGPSAYTNTTGLIASTPPATVDMKALYSGYLGSIISAGYYYKIDFFVQNICTSSTVSGLIQNSTLLPASANFKLHDGLGNELPPNSTLPGDAVSAYGVALSGKYSTGYIATYQIKVDKVDCTTGAVIAANVVNTPATVVTNGDPATISAVSLNSKSSPLGYFMMNAGCFKVTYTVANACGTAPAQIGYFNSDPAIFRMTAVNNAEAKMYPNPTAGIATVSFTLQEDKIVQASLTNIQGGASYTLFTNQSASEGLNEITFNTSTIPEGMYLYQLSDDTNTFQAGKLVITK